MKTVANKIPKSQAIRTPRIAESAYSHPVEIVMGSGRENLLLAPITSWEQRDEIDSLAHLFLLATAMLRSPTPLPAVALGELAFLCSWSDEEKESFYDSFAEALDETLRTHDPAPAREFLRLMASPDPVSSGPSISGLISEASANSATQRFGLRR